MPSCPHCQATVRADDATCLACGSSLRPSRAPAGAFSAGQQTAPVTALRRPVVPEPPLRYEGSAAIAVAPTDGGSETGPSRPPPPPPPPPAAITSETGRFPAHRPTPPSQSLVRPPVLASEALRRDLAPAAPGASSARTVAVATGLLGVLLTMLVAGPRGFGLPVGGVLLVVALLGVVPLSYAARASALAAVAGSGLAVVSWYAVMMGAAGLEAMILRAGVVVLAMALLFRAWHRGSLLARALVALGIALCAGWLWMSGTLGALLVLDSAVYSWLGPVLSVALAVLLMLSMLAFMDSRATGGCTVWAALLLAWSAAYGGVELLARVWKIDAAKPLLGQLTPEVWVALATAPLFGITLAVALAQLLAVATAEPS